MGHDTVSSRSNRKKEGIDSLMEEAATEAGRISRAIQEVAGTTACKGVQIAGLRARFIKFVPSGVAGLRRFAAIAIFEQRALRGLVTGRKEQPFGCDWMSGTKSAQTCESDVSFLNFMKSAHGFKN